MTDDHIPIQAVERVGDDARHIDGTPLPPNLPVDYRERFEALTLRASFIDDVFAHIANGGTLITIAEAWGVRHSDIAGHIGAHQPLRERYDFALVVRNEWEQERCLQELRAIMTVDIRNAYNPDGTLKNVRDLPAALAAALSSIETDELFEGHGDTREMVGYTRKVKFWDKAKAIELFMKKHGLLIERKQVTITRTLEDILSASQDVRVVEAQVVEEKSAPENGQATGGTGVLNS